MSRSVIAINFKRLQTAINNGDYTDFKKEIDRKLMLYITLQLGGVDAFTADMAKLTTDAGLTLLDCALEKYFTLADTSAFKIPVGKMITQLAECLSVPHQPLPTDRQTQLENLLATTTKQQPANLKPPIEKQSVAEILKQVGIAGYYPRRPKASLAPTQSEKPTILKTP
ncbi:MAG: hypothetical protein P1U63_05170 [Coxiellaceae bacterium]|nr:hypothetical protein [Coxiellaceae bacterium]